ncbi:hypothetical protein ACFX13_038341 [Malus domestica]
MIATCHHQFGESLLSFDLNLVMFVATSKILKPHFVPLINMDLHSGCNQWVKKNLKEEHEPLFYKVKSYGFN